MTIFLKEYTLTNTAGMQVKLLNYGATITSIKIPDKSNQLIELTLGFDNVENYLHHPFYFGCTIGRVANRIAAGKFEYENNVYHLACNENNHCHLHGGIKSFDKVIWESEQSNDSVTFFYYSPSGEEGFPGNLNIQVTYDLSADNALKISYQATTDAPTPVNLTNHTYWNLAGTNTDTILNHELEIFSTHYLETDSSHIPTGKIINVTGTPFDFQLPHKIGERIQVANGYDHYYVLQPGGLSARARDPISERILEVYTTQPGIQFYSGNYLTAYALGEGEQTKRWGGFCLETQGFPNAVNEKQFPSIMLLPGDTYYQETIYRLLG